MDNDSSESFILSILLEYPSLLNSCEEKLDKVIKNESLKKIIKTIKELNKKHGRVNASMIVENLPEDRSLIEEYLEKEIVDKDKKSALNTLESIVSNLEKEFYEEQYFLILKKHSNGEELTAEEKKELKNFKK